MKTWFLLAQEKSSSKLLQMKIAQPRETPIIKANPDTSSTKQANNLPSKFVVSWKEKYPTPQKGHTWRTWKMKIILMDSLLTSGILFPSGICTILMRDLSLCIYICNTYLRSNMTTRNWHWRPQKGCDRHPQQKWISKSGFSCWMSRLLLFRLFTCFTIQQNAISRVIETQACPKDLFFSARWIPL